MTDDRAIPVSVVILTYNEASNIVSCIQSLHLFGDIVVVDSGSTDGTKEAVLRECPHVRVLEHSFEDFGSQRNWAMTEAELKYEWVLFVDADEFMEGPLASEIEAFVAASQSYVGAYVAGRNYFLGRWLKYSTFFPSYQLRLLKRGSVTFKKEGHGQREVTDGALAYLASTWRHEMFSHGVEQWIARHNKYSSEEVELLLEHRYRAVPWRDLFVRDPVQRRRALKCLAARLPLRPFLRFFYTYFWKRGFLDGRAGWNYCLLTLAHECHVVVKSTEALVCCDQSAETHPSQRESLKS